MEKIETFPKPGNPGVKFKKVYEKMLARLELPKHVKEQLGISQVAPLQAAPAEKTETVPPAKEEEAKKLPVEAIPEEAEGGKEKEVDYKTVLGGGRYHLIPSFFSLVRALKKAKREFAVVFRDFSSDIKYVIAEFNA